MYVAELYRRCILVRTRNLEAREAAPVRGSTADHRSGLRSHLFHFAAKPMEKFLKRSCTIAWVTGFCSAANRADFPASLLVDGRSFETPAPARQVLVRQLSSKS